MINNADVFIRLYMDVCNLTKQVTHIFLSVYRMSLSGTISPCIMFHYEINLLWHIPIQMLIACRQQMRCHTVIIITDKLEIFIFCRQHPAGLTFQLFSWDCPVYDQYSSCPAEDRQPCARNPFTFSRPPSPHHNWALQSGHNAFAAIFKTFNVS